MNIFILDKGYNQLGMLSNEGANPQAPYFDDLYVQELETGADTFEFTTLSTSASESMLEIGNHIVFNFNNRQRLFAISTLELEHANGMNVIRVYAEGVGFQLLETYMGEFGEDEDGDGEVDSGEYLTYGQFLERVLADTDWSYQIVSGDLNNINMGREVTFPKGKNIYALLQDSMQVFSGVELEFRGGYSGGGLSKTIYAYANGGRGSFVGKRFEYGINVKGIKKTQEIVDEMDENVILYEGLINVDGLNVQLGYDVDFALRSHEVEELEIGDTHYIIDNDFNPPLQITARIGKIEVSFSDPTKNKCYLANFKKITGSKPDDPDGEDVEDIIDDKMDDIEDLIDEKIEEVIGDLTADHTHDRLVYIDSYDNSEHPLIYSYGGATEVGGSDKSSYILLDTDDISLNFGADNTTDNWANIYMTRHGSLSNGSISENKARIYTSTGNLYPDYNEIQYIGEIHTRWDRGYINHMHAYTYNSYFDRRDMKNVSEITDSSSVSKQDLLDFVLNDVNIYQYLPKTSSEVEPRTDNYLGVLSEDFRGSKVGSLIMNVLEYDNAVGYYNVPALVTALIGAFQQHIENTNGSGGEEGGNIDLSAYATKAWVNDIIDDIEMPDLTDYATKEFVNNAIEAIEMEVGKTIVGAKINDDNHLIFTFSDGSIIDAGELPSGGNTGDPGGGDLPSDVFEVINGKLHIKLPINFEDSAHFLMCAVGGSDKTDLTGIGKLQCCSIEHTYGADAITIKGDLRVEGNIISSGSSDTEGNLGIPDGIIEYVENPYELESTGLSFIRINDDLCIDGNLLIGGAITGVDSVKVTDALDVKDIHLTGDIHTAHTYNMSQNSRIFGDIYMLGDINMGDGDKIYGTVVSPSDKSLKENIRYINGLVKVTSDDLLEKADLHDFIVNQVNLCEFNFIGDDSNKIGFIANDYVGTKVGDKIISKHNETLSYDPNNLLFATIGALQEEVRIKDEKIASLEARLAKIEEMLGINNN
jgi:hypothetical protein